MYEQSQMTGKILNPEREDETPKISKNFFSKQAYVKRQNSTAALSARSSKVSKNFKTFYPPNYDKVSHNMEKLPKIQRFNEDHHEIASVFSKTGKKTGDINQIQKDYAYLVTKPKNSTQPLDTISQISYREPKALAPAHDLNDLTKKTLSQLNEVPDEDKEAKSELYDEINSLYDMENLKGEENNLELKS